MGATDFLPRETQESSDEGCSDADKNSSAPVTKTLSEGNTSLGCASGRASEASTAPCIEISWLAGAPKVFKAPPAPPPQVTSKSRRKSRAPRRKAKEPKIVSSLRSELRAQGLQVMNQVMKDAKETPLNVVKPPSKTPAKAAEPIAPPPGLTQAPALDEPASLEAAPGFWDWRHPSGGAGAFDAAAPGAAQEFHPAIMSTMPTQPVAATQTPALASYLDEEYVMKLTLEHIEETRLWEEMRSQMFKEAEELHVLGPAAHF